LPGHGTDIERDETDKESFIRFIGKHVNSISAVLILAGPVPPSVSSFILDFTCSNLSTIFPKTLVNNTAFVFTNVQNPFFRRLRQEDIPGALESSPVFLLDNPILQQFNDPDMMRTVKEREQEALEILVELFNWMDGLEPQPATEITSLYEIYQNIEFKTMIILGQRVREVDIDRLTIALKRYSVVSLSLCSHLALKSYARWM